MLVTALQKKGTSAISSESGRLADMMATDACDLKQTYTLYSAQDGLFQRKNIITNEAANDHG